MNIYDCTHTSLNSLEKELLFNEVMKLRNKLVDTEVLISDIKVLNELTPSLKNRIDKILNEVNSD